MAPTSTDAPSTLHLCTSCVALGLTRADFEGRPFEPEGKYHRIVTSGTVGDLRSREKSCGLCRLLLHALTLDCQLQQQPELLSRWDAEWEAEWMQSTCEYDPNTDDADDKYGSALYPKFKGAINPSNYGVQLFGDSCADTPLRARPVPNEVDVQMVAGWIDKCRKEHGQNCKDSYLAIGHHPSTTPGFLVIDVVQKCLTPIHKTDAEYVALSYVWGKSNLVTTSKSNVDLFRTAGAFDRVRLPPTIRDALDMTARLGYRFLWVDALCIVQDDETTKPHLIDSMDAIYGRASLTLVAASGQHAATGLLCGKRSRVDDINHPSGFLTAYISSDLSLAVLPFFDGELMHCPHAQRGWTYQEGCLSPRCLVFLNGLVYFVCRVNVWREDMMVESDDFLPFEGANVLGRTQSDSPLGRYGDHVRAFASRNLTYQSDVLNAFSGIERALARNMGNTKVWFGLPGAAFDWALLWRPPPGRSLDRRSGFPSWSWAGWVGDVNMAPTHWSDFDQRWLRQRTWISWLVVGSRDKPEELVPVWNSENCGKFTHQVNDIDQDEAFMPNYGNVSRHSVAALLGQSCTGPDGPHSPGWLEAASPSGTFTGLALSQPETLRFCTFVLLNCHFEQDALDSQALRMYSRRQSLLLGTARLDNFKANPNGCDLVVLSYVTPGSASPNTTAELRDVFKSSPPIFNEREDVLGTWYTWDLLNVMLVKGVPQSRSEHGIQYERIGLGVIHCTGLGRSKVIWNDVSLV
ncbi:heterokaryon incompatibility domain containing protein [Rhypophila decipiens]